MNSGLAPKINFSSTLLLPGQVGSLLSCDEETTFDYNSWGQVQTWLGDLTKGQEILNISRARRPFVRPCSLVPAVVEASEGLRVSVSPFDDAMPRITASLAKVVLDCYSKTRCDFRVGQNIILIYGNIGAGKTFTARQVAHFLSVMHGFKKLDPINMRLQTGSSKIMGPLVRQQLLDTGIDAHDHDVKAIIVLDDATNYFCDKQKMRELRLLSESFKSVIFVITCPEHVDWQETAVLEFFPHGFGAQFQIPVTTKQEKSDFIIDTIFKHSDVFCGVEGRVIDWLVECFGEARRFVQFFVLEIAEYLRDQILAYNERPLSGRSLTAQILTVDLLKEILKQSCIAHMRSHSGLKNQAQPTYKKQIAFMRRLHSENPMSVSDLSDELLVYYLQQGICRVEDNSIVPASKADFKIAKRRGVFIRLCNRLHAVFVFPLVVGRKPEDFRAVLFDLVTNGIVPLSSVSEETKSILSFYGVIKSDYQDNMCFSSPVIQYSVANFVVSSEPSVEKMYQEVFINSLPDD